MNLYDVFYTDNTCDFSLPFRSLPRPLKRQVAYIVNRFTGEKLAPSRGKWIAD